MLKVLVVVALASAAVIADATAESVLRRTDAQQPRSFESFLPPIAVSAPWLNLEQRTKLPKGDYPPGRDVEVTPFVLRAPHMEHADLAEFALGGG